jgi:hypothetical protein
MSKEHYYKAASELVNSLKTEANHEDTTRTTRAILMLNETLLLLITIFIELNENIKGLKDEQCPAFSATFPKDR